MAGSWLFDDVALAGADGLGCGLSAVDLSLLPPLLPVVFFDHGCAAGGGGGAGAGGAAARAGEAGEAALQRTAEEEATRAALLRTLDDGGVWRCLNRAHPEDCGRCVRAVRRGEQAPKA